MGGDCDMVPMTERAKLAELKRLRTQMRRIMAETGVESEEEVALEDGADPLGDEDAMAEVGAESAPTELEDEGPEDGLRRELRRYMNKKGPAPRPGSMTVAIESRSSKPAPMSGRRQRG